MDWLVLIASGMLEAVWATALGRSKGLRRPVPSIVFFIGMVLSLVGLGVAMLTIPVGTAYAVWVGIGASLTVVVAIVTKTEKATIPRMLLLVGIVGCVIGLKVVSGS
ncbi:quaternary ammonium compound-resistance protein SugE [Microbacterium resistens]|uniref:Quaternary ammonium compound-resistance protein SugE n=1 Tax=Microbacterium resistens TaxID=156977 RepID=A0ABU1SB76_9MICO|nr:multidrug efflux SMR transporter [Microbacterium resistens]MDR6866859.1 quaternary ammonium compound-resistance protein SugE [Microbacterium resistens]